MTLQEIRSKANELTKMVDGFVSEAEKGLQEKEVILDRKIKEYATLNEREKNLLSQEDGMVKERALLKKEQEALNDKQRKLDLKEDELEKKIRKVNELMQI